MTRRIGTLLALCVSAWGQEDTDIPAKFKHLITPEQYFQLRSQHVDLLRGLPADPALREAAVRMRNLQVSAPLDPLVFNPGAWTAIGPTPIPNGQVTGSLAVSGRVTSFAIDPTNTNKVYLGTAQGGVYRSTDGGTNWTQIFDNAATSAIGALALAPSNPNILFVGTGEANGSGDSYAGVGVYRVDNAGTTADLVGPINPVRNYNDGSSNPQSIPVFQGRSISSILVHPTDPSIVFVGVAGGIMGIGGDSPFGGTIPPLGMRGLIRLTNATSASAAVVAQKLTVTTAASGSDTPNTGNRNVNDMIFDPADPNIMLVWINGNATAGDGGIYRSTNVQTANPTFTQVTTTTTSGARGQFANYKEGANPTVIYVASGEGGTGTLRVSTDGGLTWSGALPGGNGFCGGQCFYNIGLDVRPGPTTAQTDDIIVLGGNVAGAFTRLFAKSTNGGTSFTESSAGLHADAHFIRIDPNNANIIWHGNDGGVFKTTNGGTNWSTLNNTQLNTVQFSGLAVHPTDPNWSIGGTQDNGTNMRMSDGTWTRIDFGDGGYALVDGNAINTTNMTLYHTYFNQTGNLIGFGRILSTACAGDGLWAFKGIYGGAVSTTPNCDGSDSFNGILISDSVLFYAPMELGPGNPNPVYFGAGALYRSTDRGDTMTAVSSRSSSPISTIAVSQLDDNYRFIGRANGTLFYTTTGSTAMAQIIGFPSGKFISRVKFDPTNKNTAYLCLGGYMGGTSAAQSHVWRYTNLNGNPVIKALNNGLPDVPVNAFAIDPANPNNLFAGTDIGVYGSLDGGTTWTPYGTSLPAVAVFGMEIQPQARKLRIATHGRGMWEIGLPPPDLTITKTHTGNFRQGQLAATYRITVTNSGNSSTSGVVTVTESVPTGLTATAIAGTGWTCTQPAGPCTRSDALAVNASYPVLTLTVNVANNAAASITNNVSVSGGGESDTSNNTATDPTTIIQATDMTITKTHTGNFTQGQTGATYTITVRNSGGTATSEDVIVTETVPAGLTATSIAGTGWACTQPAGPCTRSDVLAANTNYPAITLTVNVAGNAAASVTNSVSVAGGGELNTANNTATDATTIGGSAPDLTITKAHTGNFTQGQTGATYTITVTNSGGSATSGTVTVTETVPAGLTATSIAGTGWTCTQPSGTCTRSDALAASASYPALTLTVNVAGNAAASITNTVTVSGGGETNTGNNSASDVTTINTSPADLTITKTHTGNFTQGQTGATYTITVTNSGNSATAGTVTVTETLPTGLTATSIAGTGWTCTQPSGTCTRSDALASNSSYPVITLTVNVAGNAGASVTNTVSVSGGGETNTANNSASDVTTVVQLPDLTITKTHTGNFTQGQTGATYTITVTNSGTGPTTATVTVTETVPTGLTATSIAGNGWTCTQPSGTCTRSDALAASASYPAITLTVNVAGNAAASVTNTVSVSGGGETNTANNTANDVTTVSSQPPDLTITKTHVGNFTQGQNGATYTITVSNIGTGPTSGTVTVAETVPTGLTATSIAGTGWTCTQPSGTCTRADALAASASYPVITLTVNVAGNAAATVTNSVSVSGGGETNTANNTANDATTIQPPNGPDPSIVKTHAGNFTQGQNGAQYSLLVSNVGNAPTAGTVTVTDTLPTGMTAVSMFGTNWLCAQPAGPCTTNIPLPAGSNYMPIVVTVNIAANAPATVINTGVVSGGGDINTNNNTSNDTTTITQTVPPDMTIVKSHVGNFTQGQTGATYTLVATNSGAGPTSGTVTVSDTVPTGLTATSISGTGWTCGQPAGPCTRSDVLAPAASYPALTLVVNVAANAPTSVTNTAGVSGGGESNTANNLSLDPTTIQTTGGPDLGIFKTHVGNFTQGQNGAVYTITVSNIGNAPTTGVVTVTDNLPAGLTAVSMLGTGWTCTQPAGPCTRSDALAAAGSYPVIVLTVNVASNAGALLTNSVTATGGGDTNVANNTAIDPTTVNPALGPDLAITKSHVGNFVQGQIAAQYTMLVTNVGSAPSAGTVTVTDIVPAGLTATAIQGTGWNCAQPSGPCTRGGALPPGSNYPPIFLTVNVAGNAAASVTNTGTVSGGGDVNPSNNTSNDVTTITSTSTPDVTIVKTHVGNFTQGQAGAQFTLTVSNVGSGPTAGTVSVSDIVPTGLTATSILGTGWTCTQPAGPCTRNDALAANASYPAIVVVVTVAANAPAGVINNGVVSGGGETNTSNNSSADFVTIQSSQAPDLTIVKSHVGNFVQGQNGATYTMVVRNAGPVISNGLVTVTDVLPAGLTAISIGGAGWTCTQPGGPCTRADALPAGASYPPIVITVNVANNAPANVTNTGTVAGGGETNTANNTALDPTTIQTVGGPDLAITKTHIGNFQLGQALGQYTILVSNVGTGPSAGLVTVTDLLPAGLTALQIQGTGWNCAQPAGPCMRTNPLPAGSNYPAILLNVSVAANAPALVTNTATVAGGGDTNAANNTANDPTTITP